MQAGPKHQNKGAGPRPGVLQSLLRADDAALPLTHAHDCSTVRLVGTVQLKASAP